MIHFFEMLLSITFSSDIDISVKKIMRSKIENG